MERTRKGLYPPSHPPHPPPSTPSSSPSYSRSTSPLLATHAFRHLIALRLTNCSANSAALSLTTLKALSTLSSLSFINCHVSPICFPSYLALNLCSFTVVRSLRRLIGVWLSRFAKPNQAKPNSQIRNNGSKNKSSVIDKPQEAERKLAEKKRESTHIGDGER